MGAKLPPAPLGLARRPLAFVTCPRPHPHHRHTLLRTAGSALWHAYPSIGMS